MCFLLVEHVCVKGIVHAMFSSHRFGNKNTKNRLALSPQSNLIVMTRPSFFLSSVLLRDVSLLIQEMLHRVTLSQLPHQTNGRDQKKTTPPQRQSAEICPIISHPDRQQCAEHPPRHLRIVAKVAPKLPILRALQVVHTHRARGGHRLLARVLPRKSACLLSCHRHPMACLLLAQAVL